LFAAASALSARPGLDLAAYCPTRKTQGALAALATFKEGNLASPDRPVMRSNRFYLCSMSGGQHDHVDRYSRHTKTTHTHTHIYIYIYIYIRGLTRPRAAPAARGHVGFLSASRRKIQVFFGRVLSGARSLLCPGPHGMRGNSPGRGIPKTVTVKLVRVNSQVKMLFLAFHLEQLNGDR
jgi:hypothetical protein